MKIILAIIILVLTISPCFSDETVLNIGQNITSVFFDENSKQLYVGCCDVVAEQERHNLENFALRIIDTSTMTETGKLSLDNLPTCISTTKDGKFILVGLSRMRNVFTTNDNGILLKIDSETLKTVSQIAFDKSIDTMIVDKSGQYVYLRLETDENQSYKVKENLKETNILCKIDIKSMKVVADCPLSDLWSEGMALSSDGLKLFMINFEGESSYSLFSIYRTDNLAQIKIMPFPGGYPSYAVADDDRLFFSLDYYSPRSTPTLFEIDMDKCEILKEHYFGIVNFTSLYQEPGSDILYCTTSQPVEKDSDNGSKYELKNSNKLMLVNTTDFTSETMSIGDEPFALISTYKIGDFRRFLIIKGDGKSIVAYDMK